MKVQKVTRKLRKCKVELKERRLKSKHLKTGICDIQRNHGIVKIKNRGTV